MLVNLHHLDTARHYCDRIVALSAGRVVFDGPPSELTEDAVREIYGTEHAREFAAPRPSQTGVPANAGLVLGT